MKPEVHVYKARHLLSAVGNSIKYQGLAEQLPAVVFHRDYLNLEQQLAEANERLQLIADNSSDKNAVEIAKHHLSPGPCKNHVYFLGECTKCGAISPTE